MRTRRTRGTRTGDDPPPGAGPSSASGARARGRPRPGGSARALPAPGAGAAVPVAEGAGDDVAVWVVPVAEGAGDDQPEAERRGAADDGPPPGDAAGRPRAPSRTSRPGGAGHQPGLRGFLLEDL